MNQWDRVAQDVLENSRRQTVVKQILAWTYRFFSEEEAKAVLAARKAGPY